MRKQEEDLASDGEEQQRWIPIGESGVKVMRTPVVKF